MRRTILLLALAASCAPNDQSDSRTTVTRFYEMLDRLDVTGAPTPEALDSLSPMLTSTLRDLLRDARARSTTPM
jgi:hypothetical protein